MNLFNDKIKKIYFKYFFTAFGSTMISCIYGIVDAAMGILTIIFNRQIMKYLSIDALSIYGTIINISTFVQCCAYCIGQTAPPIISINYVLIKKYSLMMVIIFSLF